MTKAIFLDFDGVVINSIDECYHVSWSVYSGLLEHKEHKLIKTLFYRFRGLVRPVYEYGCLLEAIIACIDTPDEIEDYFFNLRGQKLKRHTIFEDIFFCYRRKLQVNKEKWISLHSLTSFGESLRGKKLNNVIIVTSYGSGGFGFKFFLFDLVLNHT